jgi:hypothetical protein
MRPEDAPIRPVSPERFAGISIVLDECEMLKAGKLESPSLTACASADLD